MKIKINSIETLDYTGSVYNMELRPVHPTLDDQYYLNADTGLVVHNCHPRDNIALRWLAQELDLGYDLFHVIMESRDRQASRMADRLIELSQQYDLPIAIHGKAYKPYVEYIDGSYSLLVGHYIEKIGHKVTYIDPLTGDDIQLSQPHVILSAHNPEVTYYETGVEIQDIKFYCDIPQGSVILDPWRTLSGTANYQVIQYGNTRCG